MNPALLLLADGRFPAGGHAHSGGAEASIGVGDVRDLAGLELLTRRRLATVGRVDAAFTAATCWRGGRSAVVPWQALQDEYLARTASPHLRTTSLALGRQLVRSGRTAWPSGRYEEAAIVVGGSLVQPLAMGLVGHAAGCSPVEVALCELHHLVAAITSAGVRLLGLDPFAVAALAANVVPLLTAIADDAAASAMLDPADLPADVTLLTDVLAEHHRTWEVRLFAS